jgi:hypothetical protein
MSIINPAFPALVKGAPEFNTMLHAMEKEVDSFMHSFKDDPSQLSGWGHIYFCDDDGGRLIFDLKKPHRHVCQVCGRVFQGQPYDGVWVYFYRNLAVLTALKAATLYRALGDATYLSYAKSIISFYAENYALFALHDKEGRVYPDYGTMEWGCGRILPQGLNESILVIRLVQALELIKDDLSPVFLEMVRVKLFDEFRQLIVPQVDAIHNIRCWNLAALGIAGLFFGDQSLVDFVFTSEFNIHRQLRKGVTADGFWYEGSIHYHFFLLEGVLALMLFCDAYGYAFGKRECAIVRRMLVNAYDYAFDNHTFPVPNDGWPDLNLKTFVHTYHIAAKVFGEDSQIGNLVKNIENDGTRRTSLPLSETYYWNNRIPLERLLFTPEFKLSSFSPVATRSANFPQSSFAMLRAGKVNVFVKYGLNGPSHAHPDIMNIEVAYGNGMVSRDLSNAGYRSRLCNEWHRKTLSHSTVCCDGQDITSCERGTCLSYDGASISVKAAEVYPGIDYIRSLAVTSSGFSDDFQVFSQCEGTRDYVFHLESGFTIARSFSAITLSLPERANGYQHLSAVEEIVREGGADPVVLEASDTRVRVVLTISLAAGQRLFLCKSMDNPVNRMRSTLIVREVGTSVRFGLEAEFFEI